MSKAWDLSCVCDGAGPQCLYCYKTNARARFQAEIDNARRKLGKDKNMSADWLDDKEPAPLPPTPDGRVGYHTYAIPPGEYGESSKIMEEVLELQDAEKQGARVMALHELSDIVGAVDGYRKKHFPDMTLDDLVTMAKLTGRAFESGTRKAKVLK